MDFRLAATRILPFRPGIGEEGFRETREEPAGRVIAADGRLIRFAQDAWPGYGSRVRALAVDRLTPRDYAERELPESPVLDASGTGWNALGMHHLDAHQLEDGSWMAAVDGAHFA